MTPEADLPQPRKSRLPTLWVRPVQSVNSSTGAVSVNAGNLADFNFDGNAILGFDATLNDQTGTAYTLLASDAGKVITCNNASAVTVTVPSGLGAGFNCSVIQKGAGQVSFTASSTTINNRQSHTKIAGQHGVASLVATAAGVFVLAGDLQADEFGFANFQWVYSTCKRRKFIFQHLQRGI